MASETCSVAGCDRPPYGRQQLCRSHHAYQARTGRTPTHALEPRGLTTEERFSRKIERVEAGCWIWTAKINASGYGVFNLSKGVSVLAHRLSYQMARGAIEGDLQLDHLCRVRACCNPEHLEPVTRAENSRRSPIWNGSKTHCKRGHEFTEENTYRWGKSRICRACRAMKGRPL